jgi:hypothetical protein
MFVATGLSFGPVMNRRRDRFQSRPFTAPPLVVGEQHGAQFGKLRRRILERLEHERALVACEGKQLDLVSDRAFEAVGEVLAAGVTE